MENSIEISVTDSGKGIPTEIRSKILEPFYTTKAVGKGTGLGLSISVGLVESHHGKFYYDENCANTRFVIVLPKTNENILNQNLKKAS
jgi:signal transduction histidine kinase